MIRFRLDTGALVATLDKLKYGQLKYAMMRAINDMGKQAQESVRKDMQASSGLHLRRERYELNQIMITKFAEKDSLVLVLQIDPRAQNLVRLVEGYDHLAWFPWNGKNYQWVPNSNVFSNRIITNNNPLAPRNLEFGFKGIGPNQKSQSGSPTKGAQRTFVLPHPKKNDIPQVWQRVASAVAKRRSRAKGTIKGVNTEGKEDSYANTRMLYTLVSRQKTPVKLKFYEPISKTVHETYEAAMAKWLAVAVTPGKK